MTAPLFSESPDENASSDTDSTIPVTTAKLDVGGESPITISNFREQLPETTSAKARGALVRALEAVGMLSADARHALARATVHPDDLAPQVRNRSLIVETGETADVTQITGQVWTTELWPLLQPRTEAEALTVERPVIVGELDEQGNPLALLTMQFRSLQHLVDYLRETIALTGRTGNDYSASVLARRVGRAVLAHVVRLEFTDGTPSFLVVALRDGNTRLVSAVAARMGLRTTDGKVADQLVEDLLATVPPRAGKQPDPAIDRARGRDRVAQELRTRFNAGMATGRPTEDAIRIGQTFTLPATVYLHVEASATAAVPPEQVFAESMRAVVGSIHTEFKGWDTAAQSVDVGERALQRAQYAGRLPADLVRLATGALDVEDVPKVFGDASIPPTALWRGVYLVHGLTQVAPYAAVKEQLRSLLGLSIIQRKKFATYLGPMVDVPWRASKYRSLVGARRAWGATGPVPHALLGTDWQPVPTSDFLSLVPRALAGDTNARYTLQVAGGIALVADRLLASNTGSAVTYGTVPFRADVHEVVASLGGPGNLHGLYQLAHAAQVFDADKAAVNSFTDRDFAATGKTTPTGAYVVPLVDPADPTKPLLDATGQPVPLTQWEVVRISNPERAAKAISEAKADAQADAGFTVPESAVDKAQHLRLQLENGLKAIQDLIAELESVSNSGEPAVGPALGTPEDWMRLSVIGNKVSSWITMNEPPEPNTDDDEDLEEDQDDDLDDEGDGQSD